MNGFGRRTFGVLATLLLALGLAAGCGEEGVVNPPPQNPQHIAIRYLLVGFNGSVPGQIIQRSKAEAEELAHELHGRALAGEDFGKLQEEYSDSPNRDTIHVANYNVFVEAGEYARATLFKGLGDVAFAIVPDSIGLAEYDSTDCPVGWFLVQRLE